jgi:hypothetical protein
MTTAGLDENGRLKIRDLRAAASTMLFSGLGRARTEPEADIIPV